MKHVSLEEAKVDLASLVEAATRGEPFVIEDDGRPLVEVRAAPAVDTSKRIGFLTDLYGPQTPIKEVGRKEVAEMFGLDEADL